MVTCRCEHTRATGNETKEDMEKLKSTPCVKCKSKPVETANHFMNGNPTVHRLLDPAFVPSDEEYAALDAFMFSVEKVTPATLSLLIREAWITTFGLDDHVLRKNWVNLSTTYLPELDTGVFSVLTHEIQRIITLGMPEALNMDIESILRLDNGDYLLLRDMIRKDKERQAKALSILG